MATNVPAAKLDIELIQGAVKAAVKEAGARSSDLYMVPLDQISVIEGFNVRITGTKVYDDGIQSLKRSIMAEGFYRDKPLTGFVGKADDNSNTIFLTDGHRRFAAVALAVAEGAEITELPVLLKPPGTTMEDLTVALAKTGEPLTPYELGIVIKRLTTFNLDPEVISTRLGITKRYVDDLLFLMAAPAKIRKMVMDGAVSAGQAVRELRASGASASEVLGQAVDNAKAAGKTKATGKDIKKTDAKKKAEKEKDKKAAAVKPEEAMNAEWSFEAKAGEVVKLADIALFQTVAGGTWYSLDEKAGQVQIVQDVKFKLTMKRKAKSVLPADADDL